MRIESSRCTHWAFAAVVFLLFCYAGSPVAAMDLVIHIDKQGNALHVLAKCPYDTIPFTIDEDTAIVRKLMQICDLIEPLPEPSGTMDTVSQFLDQQLQTMRGWVPLWKDEKSKAAEPAAGSETLSRLLDDAGHLLFDPIAPLMAAADRIRFVVTQSCLFYPFDAAFHDGTPLFLKKPVLYSLAEIPPNPVKASSDWQGMIISDPAADPAAGTAAVAALFPRSVYYDAARLEDHDMQAALRAAFPFRVHQLN
jgi:hypothetical protein